MRWRAYPEYKPSGVRWVGDVPEHWECGNIRRYATMKTGHTPSRNRPEYWTDCTIPWFGLADVWQLRDGKRKYLGETNEKISELGLRNSSAELLPAGTVVFSRTASIGFSGIMPQAMATTQDFWNWICGPKLIPDYLLYIFRAMGQEFQALTMGSTHKTIYQPVAASISVPVAPLGEQGAIAAFLDRETGRIDGLIAKKQRQIELLAEKRSALISHAVTKGLDPNVKMKDSGHPGLGDVPRHWRMAQLRHLTDPRRPIMYGIVLPGPHVDDGVPIVKGGNCEPGRLQLDLMSRTTFEIEARYVRSRLRNNDIVYAIRGSIGECEIVPPELEGANMTQDAARVSPGPNVNERWLLYALRSHAFFSHLDAHATGATIRGINIWDLKRAPICIPPLEEQDKIAEFLLRNVGRLDTVRSHIETSVTRLREYRTALISAAVTGKIDVREEVAS